MAEILTPFGPSTAVVEPDKEAIRVLEHYLEMAKAGEVVAVAIAGVSRNRDLTSEWGGEGCANLLLGAVHYLQVRYDAGFHESASR